MRYSSSVSALLVVCCSVSLACTQPAPSPLESLTKHYDGLHGQLQVGGPFVGIEFHHSRPAPSRISFYYPVANSIDLSTDYWERDRSMPLFLYLTIDGEHLDLGRESLPYDWTPAHVRFARAGPNFEASISYRFGESLPIMVLAIEVTNRADHPVDAMLSSELETRLRTSHSYRWRDSARVEYGENGSWYRADFDAADTDSATVFVANAGEMPESVGDVFGLVQSPSAEFVYRKKLDPGETLRVIQIVGSSRRAEAGNIIEEARATWMQDVDAFEKRVTDFVNGSVLSVQDSSLMETARWSKAIQETNRHPLEEWILPMPCPAQYNFFFTHDLQLTNLGVVQFDTAHVAHDLRYLLHLDGGDHILTHARYWRDGAYVSEAAGSDNWNHLWFILLSGSYLKHSADTALVGALYPMVSKSLDLMMENYDDGLMQGVQPDWWDIAKVYGPKAYLTILTIRAIRTYAYISTVLGRRPPGLSERMALAESMQTRLIEELWDEEAGYILNYLDNEELDRHLYMGSLLAVVFDLVDDDKKARMLETARTELLDPAIGLRTVVPTDFHELVERYRLVGMEAGMPGRYINGGVWPHGNAWYAMALLAGGQPDSALAAIRKYYTLDGIANSPGGQPNLYEYRRTDKDSPHYGEIDKTTFLWAGGWYLWALYQLAGVRENEWNIRFDANLPAGFENASLDLMAYGQRARVVWSGSGKYFREIRLDGRDAHSAVLLQPASEIELVRGRPGAPYLERASAIVHSASYDADTGRMEIELRGIPGQHVDLAVLSPIAEWSVLPGADPLNVADVHGVDLGEGLQRIEVSQTLKAGSARIAIEFAH